MLDACKLPVELRLLQELRRLRLPIVVALTKVDVARAEGFPIDVERLQQAVGLPLVADRLGSRRGQLVASSVVAVGGLLAIIAAPDLAFLWIAVLGLALGAVFPLVLTLPLDVTDDPTRVGSVAALMLFGGYVLSSLGPVLLGVARDVSGDFAASEWMLVAIAVVLVASCVTLSPDRLRRGIHRTPVA